MKDLEQIIKEVTLEIAMAGTDNPEQVSSDNRKKIMREVAVRYATQQVEKFNSEKTLINNVPIEVLKDGGFQLKEKAKIVTLEFTLIDVVDSSITMSADITILPPEESTDKEIDSLVKNQFDIWIDSLKRKVEILNVQ